MTTTARTLGATIFILPFVGLVPSMQTVFRIQWPMERYVQEA